MATAHVQSKGAITNAATSLGVTFSSNVASGNHLMSTNVAFHSASDPVLAIATSSPSNTWQNGIAEQHLLNGSDWEAYRLDYAENVASGSTTVTTHCTSASDLTAFAREASGIATSTSIGSTNTNSTTVSGTTLTTGSITPVAGSFLDVITVPDKNFGNTGASTINTGGQASNFTVPIAGGAGTIWDSNVNVPGGNAYFADCAATATNPTWTAATTCARQMAAIIEFKATGGGGGGAATIKTLAAMGVG